MKKVFLIIAMAVLTLSSCGMKSGDKSLESKESQVLDSGQNQTNSNYDPADRYTDIALPGPQGQTVKVSDYVGKNKLVLIDFWASWCGPCRAEMPYVVKAYDQFHPKGLEIVGVSLDKDKESWTQAIEMLGQKWPQMSDLKGWECEGGRLYGIQSIPANVLIDEQGRIVARDLRGDSLLKEIEARLAAGTVAE